MDQKTSMTSDVGSPTFSPAKPRKEKEHEDELTCIKNAFKEDFEDEIDDCNKYCDMATRASQNGYEELAQGLSMIAWDEYTHARFIHEHLADWGCVISETETTKWEMLKERIYRKFQNL